MSPPLTLPRPKCTQCKGQKNKNVNLCKRHFQALQKSWYRRLEKDGFEDIEQGPDYASGVPDGNLKEWHSTKFMAPSNVNRGHFSSKEEYYRIAGHFLHEHVFANETERFIFELHGEGKSILTILSVLRGLRIKIVSGHKVNKKNVHDNIRKHVAIMLGKLK